MKADAHRRQRTLSSCSRLDPLWVRNYFFSGSQPNVSQVVERYDDVQWTLAVFCFFLATWSGRSGVAFFAHESSLFFLQLPSSQSWKFDIDIKCREGDCRMKGFKKVLLVRQSLIAVQHYQCTRVPHTLPRQVGELLH